MIKRIRICNLSLCFILLLGILTGCWDKREIEELSYVIGIGIDKAEKEGQIKVTYLFANPEVGSSLIGGTANEPARETLTFTANDYISARNTANSMIPREIIYDLLRIIVVSEEMARDENFIKIIYDTIKDREIRRDVHLAVSKENASEYLNKNNPKIDTRPHKYFQFMINRGVETGMIPDSDLHRFYLITEQDADLYLSIYTSAIREDTKTENEDEYIAGQLPTKGEANKTQFFGSAVFKEGKMIGTLDGEETRIAGILDETTDLNDVLTTFPDPFNEKERISTRVIKKERNKVKMNLRGSKPKIRIEIPLIVEVLSDPEMVDYAENEKNREILKRKITESLNNIYRQFIKKSQEEFKACPFSLSEEARKYFKTIKEFEDFDWMKSYPEMDIEVSVKIRLGEFGEQTKLPSLKETRD
ncbi:Ger(x)C family spore germination protein [Bacillus massilinigeriensis]|uniref:Ger(x)C family spore germination protein n=1 Tax=Bacillus massilionigeriensis TaxID=1805475 RepID=UPI00096B25BC|nr:Ger(x)C family spore germination protein [Bacillus massilionigeriensis]